MAGGQELIHNLDRMLSDICRDMRRKNLPRGGGDKEGDLEGRDTVIIALRD